MKGFILKIYIYIFQLTRELYDKKNSENKVNYKALGFLLFLANIHSILLISECLGIWSFGLLDFWKPTPTSSITNIVIGATLTISIVILMSILFGKIWQEVSQQQKIKLLRKILLKNHRKSTAIIYLVFSVLIFITSFVWTVNIIIPKGGL